MLTGVGLAAGLTSIVDDVRPHTSISTSTRPARAVDRAGEVTGHLLAIVGEALSNVVRHSRATTSRIVARDEPPEWLLLTVEDDGQGSTGRRRPARTSRLVEHARTRGGHRRNPDHREP